MESDTGGVYLTVSSKEFDAYHRIKERLSDPIDSRNKKLEVGLVRISYPISWYTLEEEAQFQIVLAIPYIDLNLFSLVAHEDITADITIQPNHQNNLDLEDDFIESINKTAWEKIEQSFHDFSSSLHHSQMIFDKHLSGKKLWRMIYDKTTKRILIDDPYFGRRANEVHIRIRHIKGIRLWKILGFDQINSSTNEEAEYLLPLTGEREPTVASLTTLMNIYAPSLVQNQRVGDTLRPLLEIIPVLVSQERNNSIVTYSQTKPVYKRVIGGYINEVIIEIRDHNDRLIPLISGQVNLTLHLRPCRTWHPQLKSNFGEAR